MEYKVLLYYHFAPIKDYKEFSVHQLAFCKANNILGRILVSEQGINGTCAGSIEDIERYMKYVRALPGFKKIWFKEQIVSENPFTKIFVRHKKELVLSNEMLVNPSEGNYITPKAFNKLYEKKKDDLVIIDMRNEIEYQVGHFENAVNTGVKHFREVPVIIDKFKHAKDKTIVMYCTGGIRCELATPYFKKKGFKKVYQIKGGIYNYCEQYPEGYFKGDCYVFDDRLSLNFDKDGIKTWEETSVDRIISNCNFCNEKCNRIVNNEGMDDGRDQVICCDSCDTKLDISRVRKVKAK